MSARLLIVLASLLPVACGAPLMRLPAGPGAPAPDASDALARATASCRGVSSVTAEIAASGSIGGTRVRARIAAGLASPALARLEAVALGQPVFIFVARGQDATLLLTRDRRVLQHAAPAEALEAVTGVRLDPADLRAVLLGCAGSTDTLTGSRFGDDWRMAAQDGRDLYLRRLSPPASWRLVAAVHRETPPPWRVEYRDFVGDLPREVHLVSSDPLRFDLRLALSQVRLNTALDPSAFDVVVPPAFEPIGLDEIRRQGPLAMPAARGDGG